MKPLSASTLACGYAGKTVLDGLDLSVDQGRFVCLIGPNGAGKSTLARTLAGLQPPISGDIVVHGKHLKSMRPTERAQHIAVVLTGLPSIGYLTVRRFVEIGRHPYTGTMGRLGAADDRAVDVALEEVGVAHLGDRWLSEISDGERQRAAVARAFAQAASVLVLDEPTAFLDVESRARIMTTLRDLAHNTGRSILATSHDIELVLRIADELWIITPGRDLLRGVPEDLVLQGAMDSAFPGHVMEFDLDTGGFRLPRSQGRPIGITGTTAAAEWTARALERIGRGVRRDTRTEPWVEVAAGHTPSWLIHSGSTTIRANSIAAVVDHIRRLT